MATKYLGDNEIASTFLDKNFVVTKGSGVDFIASFDLLVEEIEELILRRQFLRDVGRKLIFNVNNNYRDSTIINDGAFDYVLLNGQELKTSEFKDLAAALFKDTSETFTVPDFKDATIRQIVAGSGRPLGDYEEDSFASHQHQLVHTHTASPHKHSISQNIKLPIYQGSGTGGGGSNVLHIWDASIGIKAGTDYLIYAPITGGATSTADTTITINQSNDYTTNVGDTETRMKNIGVQIYMCARYKQKDLMSRRFGEIGKNLRRV